MVASIGAGVLLACSGGTLEGGSNGVAGSGFGAESPSGVLFVRQAFARGTGSNAEACAFKAERQWPALAEGILDLGVRDRYDAALLLESREGGVRVEGAHVRILGGDGSATLLGEIDTIATGFVEPGGLGVASLQAIDVAVAEKLRESLPSPDVTVRVVLEIAIRGAPAPGGATTVTPTFRLPLSVCVGCLVSFTSGDDPAAMGQNCTLPLSTSDSQPCRIGQDETVPCQLCREDRPACRGQ